jgi:hypothetical protein
MACSDDVKECPYDEIADLAVKKAFAIIGVNIDDPHEVEEFRKDLRFSGEMRAVTTRGFLAATGFAVTAALALIWSYISNFKSG